MCFISGLSVKSALGFISSCLTYSEVQNHKNMSDITHCENDKKEAAKSTALLLDIKKTSEYVFNFDDYNKRKRAVKRYRAQY